MTTKPIIAARGGLAQLGLYKRACQSQRIDGVVTLDDVAEWIRTGAYGLAEATAEARRLYELGADARYTPQFGHWRGQEQTGKAAYGAFKSEHLPSVTPAGVFRGKRLKEEPYAPACFVPLDYDELDTDEDVARTHAAARLNPATRLLFTSARGASGAKLLFNPDPFPSGAGGSDGADEFLAAWTDGGKAYKLLGIDANIDTSGKDCSRLMFLAHDPDVHYNPDGVGRVSWSMPAPAPRPTSAPAAYNGPRDDSALDRAYRCLPDYANDADMCVKIWWWLDDAGRGDLAADWKARSDARGESRFGDVERLHRARKPLARDVAIGAIINRAKADGGYTTAPQEGYIPCKECGGVREHDPKYKTCFVCRESAKAVSDAKADAKARRAAAPEIEKNGFRDLGYNARVPGNWVAWMLRHNDGRIMAAYEYDPPLIEGERQEQVGEFFRITPNGILDRRADAIGPLREDAAGARLKAMFDAGLDAKEFGAAAGDCQKMRTPQAIETMGRELPFAVGAMRAAGDMPDGTVIDAALIDADRRYMAFANGIVDLHTGALARGNPLERGIYISRQSPRAFNPDASHPAWDALKAHPTTDPEIIEFALDSFAFALHGQPNIAKRLIVLCDDGAGDSGKTQLCSAIRLAFGDFAGQGNVAMFDAKPPSGGASPAFAPLAQYLIVVVPEMQSIKDANSDGIKAATGEPHITYRMLRHNFVTRAITGTIVGMSNGVAQLPLWDEALYLRYVPVMFRHIPKAQQDASLSALVQDPAFQEAVIADIVRRAAAQVGAGGIPMPPELPPAVEADKTRHLQLAIGQIGMFVREKIRPAAMDARLSTAAVWLAWQDYIGEAPNDKGVVGDKKKGEVSRVVTKRYQRPSKGMRIDGKQQTGWLGLELAAKGAEPKPPDDAGLPQGERTALSGAYDYANGASETAPARSRSDNCQHSYRMVGDSRECYKCGAAEV